MDEIEVKIEPMQIKSFTFNPFMENTYVLFDDTKEAVIIDPGCYEDAEEQELLQFVKEKELNIKLVLNTHGHIDHVLGNSFCKRTFNAPLWIGTKDLETLKSVEVYAPNYGFQNYNPSVPDKLLDTEDTIPFGNSELRILFVPGHAPGHLAFYEQNGDYIIGGDVLFQSSIGRTDLPGGDFDMLIQSIRAEFFKFADNTAVYPGHGEITTIGMEKRTNPFCSI